MELKINTQQVLKILLVVAWIIFIGLSIEAGGILFNAFYVLMYRPEGAKNIWQMVDLSALYQYDRGNFTALMVLIIIVSVMKASLFYMIVKILHERKLNMAKPFNAEVGRFIFNICYLSLGIGFFSWRGAEYAKWITKQGVFMPGLESLRLSGADVWLFMGVTLFVIAQVFKRGIEIQTENDLTV
jgi:hypothetical protein